jgi:hypothetical protein
MVAEQIFEEKKRGYLKGIFEVSLTWKGIACNHGHESVGNESVDGRRQHGADVRVSPDAPDDQDPYREGR